MFHSLKKCLHRDTTRGLVLSGAWLALFVYYRVVRVGLKSSTGDDKQAVEEGDPVHILNIVASFILSLLGFAISRKAIVSSDENLLAILMVILVTDASPLALLVLNSFLTSSFSVISTAVPFAAFLVKGFQLYYSKRLRDALVLKKTTKKSEK